MTSILQNNLPHYQISKSSKLIGETGKRSSSNLDQPIDFSQILLLHSKKRLKGRRVCDTSFISQESENTVQNVRQPTSIDFNIADACSEQLCELATNDEKPSCISPSAIVFGTQKVGIL